MFLILKPNNNKKRFKTPCGHYVNLNVKNHNFENPPTKRWDLKNLQKAAFLLKMQRLT